MKTKTIERRRERRDDMLQRYRRVWVDGKMLRIWIEHLIIGPYELPQVTINGPVHLGQVKAIGLRAAFGELRRRIADGKARKWAGL